MDSEREAPGGRKDRSRQFHSDGKRENGPFRAPSVLPFAVALLAILMAHEMGHFLACRHYGIDATYPYVLPAPPFLNPFGTFGAVIRIKSPFGDSRQLFDVG